MADDAQYKIELVSAESDSGESTVVRGITYKPNNTARRQKHYRRPKEVEKCENFKNFGISLCILLAFSVVLWASVLSLLIAELFKRTVELQKVSTRTSLQMNELTNEIQNWHNYSKTIGNDQSLQMAQISTLERELSDITALLGKLEKRLVAVEEKESRPQFFNMVQEQVSTLTSSIAGLSNQVENIKLKLAGFRDDGDTRAQILSHLKLNLTNLAQTVSRLNKTMCGAQSSLPNRINASTILYHAIEAIRPEMNAMNESLSKRLRYLSEDQEKDHKLFTELQESLANVSSQVISLLQNTEAWKTNFNNLELKILTIREKFKAIQTKQFEKVTAGMKMEPAAVSARYDDKTMPRTTATGLHPIKEDSPTTLMMTTPVSPEIDILLSDSPTKYLVT